jgi:hypothetical protein
VIATHKQTARVAAADRRMVPATAAALLARNSDDGAKPSTVYRLRPVANPLEWFGSKTTDRITGPRRRAVRRRAHRLRPRSGDRLADPPDPRRDAPLRRPPGWAAHVPTVVKPKRKRRPEPVRYPKPRELEEVLDGYPDDALWTPSLSLDPITVQALLAAKRPEGSARAPGP